jgi:putative endonuclease
VAGAEARSRGPRGDERRSLGAEGEALAAGWYAAAGYEVLDHNWRCRAGELDLVVRGDDALVFCEVKTRRGDAFGVPAESVTPAKQRRIRGLATRWLDEHPTRAVRIRFDVVSVLVAPGREPTVDVISDAF